MKFSDNLIIPIETERNPEILISGTDRLICSKCIKTNMFKMY